MSANSAVTPGIPPASETVSVRKLSGRYTPVNAELRLTAARAAPPDNTDTKARSAGLLFLAILLIITNNTKAQATIAAER